MKFPLKVNWFKSDSDGLIIEFYKWDKKLSYFKRIRFEIWLDWPIRFFFKR